MGKRRPKLTVLDHCTAALGVHRGALCAAHVAQWAIATDDLGHVPTTVEYAEYWAISERTAWRRRAAVASVFGEDWQVVVQSVAAHIGDRRSPRAVMGLTVAAA